MKRIVYIILAVVCWGCELDYLPPTEITEEKLVENLKDVEKAFMEAYVHLVDIAAELPNFDYAMGDDFVPNEEMGNGTVSEVFNHNASSMYASQSLEYFYTDVYEMIGRCNLCLNQLNQVPATDTVFRNQLRGEALALRALGHHVLVSRFARPYRDQPAVNAGVVLRTEFALTELPRATVAKVYEQIVRDLKDACRDMTVNGGKPERFTADAASLLLSRVYLFMQDWDEVIGITSGLIDKLGLPADLTVDCGELFTVSADCAGFTPPFYNVRYECLPTEALMGVYEGLDYRKGFYEGGGASASLVENINTVKEIDWSDASNLENTFIAYMIGSDNFEKAFANVVWEEVAPENRNAVIADRLDWLVEQLNANPVVEFKKFATRDAKGLKMLRMVEAYLNRAEAYWENGEYSLAKTDLMTVMEHEGLNYGMDYMMLMYNVVSDEELIDYILRERRREFALEGFRSMDLLRRGMPLVRYYGTTPAMTVEPQLNMKADDPLRILPIPKKEMRLNASVVQNEGYSGDRSF